jgi:AcrR family transcriptional regulator
MTVRLSSEERREAILLAAISEFALWGLHGASTARIATAVGISQPYLFKIYGTKKELFIAAVHRVYDDTLAALRAGIGRHPDMKPLDAMGRAFANMVSSRDELLMLLQTVASTADDDIRAVVRVRFEEVFSFVKSAARVSDYEVRMFIGYGLLLAAMSGMGIKLRNEHSDALQD